MRSVIKTGIFVLMLAALPARSSSASSAAWLAARTS